ncbi:MAG: RnfABCDGE type electron transport complex subunit D [Oscillospiraceae bacterium]|nr:RnfABCDGE type electron transport complex subunit D [Oscillospiraceae bacterium]
MEKLIVSPSPHQRGNSSTTKIMTLVIIALIPSIIAATVIFGLRALILVLTCVASSVLFEFFCRKIMKRDNTISDFSAAVTGIILALNFPVTLPLWMAVLGCFVAIVITKQLFGGIGQNFANPAIVGRLVLTLSFTKEMSTWVKPFWYSSADLLTAPTPLAEKWLVSYSSSEGFVGKISPPVDYVDLFLGKTGGCIGETCAVAIILGGIFLLMTRVISPAAPLTFIGTLAVLTAVSGGDALYHILSGGLLFGAFFMATDYVTTPVTTKGKVIFGIGCGLITFLIRTFGAYPEGVSFAILLMNLLTPYIDRLTRTKPFGMVKVKEVKGNG